MVGVILLCCPFLVSIFRLLSIRTPKENNEYNENSNFLSVRSKFEKYFADCLEKCFTNYCYFQVFDEFLDPNTNCNFDADLLNTVINYI